MVSFLHLVLALPLLSFIILLLKSRTNKKPATVPPGPKGLPIIGNLHQLDNSSLHFQLLNLSKIYGPIFSLRIGLRPAIVISTPGIAKKILNDHDLDVSRRPPNLGNQKISYNGIEIIFSPYNDTWREIRKLVVVHILSFKKVSIFSHVRKDEVKKMIKKISGHVCSSKITNLSEIVLSTSISIIWRIGFGRKCDEEGAEKSRIHGLLNETEDIFTSFFISDHIPFMGWIDRLTGLRARVENAFKRMDMFSQEVLNEHLDPNRPKETEEGDIVDVLLRLQKQGHLSIDLTHDHIKGVIMDLIVGGTDTSASTSVWVMTALMKYPRTMKKAQEEVRNLYGNKEFIDEEDIQKLKYLKAVIKETFRLYPTAPLLPRETNKSFIVDGYEIQPKTLVYVNTWAIHRDPEAWKDPDEFYPERFLNNDIDFKGRDFELIPFGAGRRICPGLPMGIATVELIIANLLNSFDWELPIGMAPEDIDVEGLPGLVVQKKNHLCLVAKNRK
ncbi:5-OH-xanthotoxin synthase-like [Lotus japonicus]|uniref:5-OH-xanthotoxin synthase-like n=1 Tax=Lotus japonicus TaxID=34305 RepID=UPI002588DE6D|nr:5-OH-xanthotoxin synthase-like [Lotus japonicus]